MPTGPCWPFDSYGNPRTIPLALKPVPPLADRRTGKVRLPTIWTALAERVLDPHENEGTRKLCAETLARLMLASQEKGGLSGD